MHNEIPIRQTIPINNIGNFPNKELFLFPSSSKTNSSSFELLLKFSLFIFISLFSEIIFLFISSNLALH